MTISLNMLSDKQRQAWIMRYRYGWRLKRIALEMGTTPGSVSRLLVRGMLRAGLPRCRYVRIIRTKPRVTGVLPLSQAFEQV